MSQLSIIIPAYNESQSLPILIERLDNSLRAAKLSYQVIVIDDHSVDGTYKKAQALEKRYPLQVFLKKGMKGKAQSILEGVQHVKSDYIVMIDADLQYPPEAIPEMYAHAIEHGHGVVVARRKVYEESTIRRYGSRGIAFVCGKLLHGFDCDIQSGLKIFKRQIVPYINLEDISPWSLDLPLLHTAKELGYTIGQTEIDFVKREFGSSKLSLLKPTMEIMKTAITLKFRRIEPEQTRPTTKGSMLGAGVKYRGKQFVTHSTLPHAQSALHVITPTQRSFLFILLGFFLIGLGINALFAFQVVVGILSFIYFVDVVFNFFLILKSLHSPPEINPSRQEMDLLKDKDLPVYSILCPLYREAHIIPHFVEAMTKLEWPKNKLDVMLLLEEDDTESVEAVKTMKLPSYVRVVVVPDSQPKTKPKACNYGLNLAKGEFVVIYDAEDKPDPMQLKVAYLAFQTVGPDVKCLQAKLNYYNPNQNWLTRLFTAEYSLWFDVILTGLQSIQTTIPLGGTSNHFRRTDLLDFEGWDPFNVTEDCDLGVRLFKRGAKTAIIDSTTLEEANSNFKNWIRQRSRWIKGYMQTYLLHMRDPMDFASTQGIHAVLFQLTVGGKIAFILINPILWILTIAYFVLYRFVGPTIESLYPTMVFYMAVTSLIFGNFMFIYYYMIGAAKREHWGLMKWIFLIPLYWLMVSIAGCMALYQLIVKPHYWEKTVHGLHLQKKIERHSRWTVQSIAVGLIANSQAFLRNNMQALLPAGEILVQTQSLQRKFSRQSAWKVIKSLIVGKYNGATLLVIAMVMANGLNMLTSLSVSRILSFSEFALYSTVTSLLYLVYIPTGALSAAINYKTSFLLGKYKMKAIYTLWRHYTVRGAFLAIVAVGVWIVLLPLTSSFLHSSSILPLLLFTPTIAFGILSCINEAYLRATRAFHLAAIAVVVEALARFSLIWVFVIAKLPLAVLSVPALAMGIYVAFLLFLVIRFTPKDEHTIPLREFRFPWTFFSLTALTGLSSIAFFSLDTVLAVHFLTSEEAGMYGLLGVLGKIMFFAGSLTAGFILPFISREEGQGQDSRSTFERLFMLTAALVIGAQLLVGIAIPLASDLIGSPKIIAIRNLLPIYGLGIMMYTLAQTIVSYYLAKREYIVAFISVALALVQVTLLWLVHDTLTHFVVVMTGVGAINFILFGLFYHLYPKLRVPLKNLSDLVGLFQRLPSPSRRTVARGKYRILFFNWRDIRHSWAGGAEVYIHEIAKRLVLKGHDVTIFCGNDGKSERTEMIDGIRIIRRGGFYTVYIWAALYYILRLREQTDIVVDSENGIPFLTPLYVFKPIHLLIHHVHQDVLRAHLHFPFSEIAAFIEGDIMPFLYNRHHILTVSKSSKKDILDLGLGKEHSIGVVSPGIDLAHFKQCPKTENPSFVYIGRLKQYKNIDIAIKAFAKVVERFPKATFEIAGSGESEPFLKEIVHDLKLERSVKFRSFVSEREKVKLFGESWVAVQPSMVEGFGITVIEANACGTPVIASNVKGLRDSVMKDLTGVLVAPRDIKALADAMLALTTDRRLRERLSKSALKLSKDYGWDDSADRFLLQLEPTEEYQSSLGIAHTHAVEVGDNK